MAGLRQYGGLSGFPKREESPHDAFGTGHASTALSAALGMARARDLKGEDHHVVVVVGDIGQRARLARFLATQAFVDWLGAQVLAKFSTLISHRKRRSQDLLRTGLFEL